MKMGNKTVSYKCKGGKLILNKCVELIGKNSKLFVLKLF